MEERVGSQDDSCFLSVSWGPGVSWPGPRSMPHSATAAGGRGGGWGRIEPAGCARGTAGPKKFQEFQLAEQPLNLGRQTQQEPAPRGLMLACRVR